MNEFTGSTQEIADKMGVEYPTALAVVKLLLARKIAKEAGVRPSKQPGGRGRGAALYTVPTTPFSLCLFPVENLQLPDPQLPDPPKSEGEEEAA